MKGWLSRAAAATVLRGEERGNRVARWSRWFPRTPAVDGARFQDDGEPWPRHWRRFPAPWRRVDPADPAVRRRLTEALGELPEQWRAVVWQRDVQHRSPAEVSADLGLSDEQQRAMLNRARAHLRERLADLAGRR